MPLLRSSSSGVNFLQDDTVGGYWILVTGYWLLNHSAAERPEKASCLFIAIPSKPARYSVTSSERVRSTEESELLSVILNSKSYDPASGRADKPMEFPYM